MTVITNILLALVTTIIGWFFGGRYANRKALLDLKLNALQIQKDEQDFKDSLMREVQDLQKQILNLMNKVHELEKENSSLRSLVADHSSKISQLELENNQLKNEKLS